MNPTLESLAKDFKVCKINVDANQELAARFRVSAVPTLLIFKDGKVVARHEGAVSESILRADLERYR